MTTQIALLRAINVGGRTRLAMADLKKAFAALGHEDARTILQTGNVIFRSKVAAGKLERQLEEALDDTVGLKTALILRTAAQWEALIAANPYPDFAKNDPSHLLVMPLKEKPAAGALDALRAAIRGRETVELMGRDLYITYPDGIGRSRLTNALIEKTLGARGTGRNWRTVLKIAEAARD
jgi:uncharacterized protein (DUF1697 family)